MKISVIFTGGTIGSKLSGGYIGVSGCPYTLIENWRREHGGCEFDTCEPYTILSGNSSFEHLCKLAACAREKSAAAEAVIITHGTDTLCYTAAFLGLALSDIKKPIVLVSSGCPLVAQTVSRISRRRWSLQKAAKRAFSRCGMPMARRGCTGACVCCRTRRTAICS